MKKTFHIILGTKGQFIKMAPVIKELEKRDIKFNLIHTRQHTEITRVISQAFEIKKSSFFLVNQADDVVNILQLVVWFFKCIVNGIRYKKKLWKNCKGICLIHGDTPSTLLGLVIAKINGIKVAHIESGLRSYLFFHPFPEEIIRIVTMKFADYLFAPSEWAYMNLVKMKVQGNKVNTNGNTVFDAIKYGIGEDSRFDKKDDKFVVATFHRVETLYHKKRFLFCIGVMEKISRRQKIIFVVHKPTMVRLKKYGLLSRITSNKNIVMKPYYEYFSFIHLIRKAEFVVVDGGGLQEETYYLNIPCLILRKKTERFYGLKETSYLSNFNFDEVDYFCENYKNFMRKEPLLDTNPSKKIVDILIKEL